MKKILMLITMIFSVSVFACDGIEPIALNDTATLHPWGIELEDDDNVHFESVIKGFGRNNRLKMYISNKNRKETHEVTAYIAGDLLIKIKLKEYRSLGEDDISSYFLGKPSTRDAECNMLQISSSEEFNTGPLR